MKRQSIFFQLLIALILLLGVTILSTGYFGTRSLRSYAETDAVERQWELVRTLAALYAPAADARTEGAVDEFLARLPISLGYRITVIAVDGTVLGDTHEDAALMDNHRGRPEVRTALGGGKGYATRRSDTLGGEHLIYTAYFDPHNAVVFRVARTVEGLQEGLDRSVTALMLFAVMLIVVSVILSVLAARWMSRLILSIQTVAEHYARGDFSRALTTTGFREAEELSRSLNRMGRQLQDTIRALELRQKELQSMLEGMTAPVVLVDADLDIREINPAARLLAEGEGDPVGRGLLPVFRSPELYDLTRHLIDGGDTRELLVRLDRPAGTFWLQVHASLIFREGDEHAGCLLVMNDVTRITQLEMMRKDFVANVSHELRTPITSILGFVETLQMAESLDRERQADFLGIVQRQAVRLERIIEDLMALSRLEEGDGILPLESVRASALFEDALATLAFKAESRRIHVSIDADPELRCCAYPILAEQAVVNLLDNAIKYSPEGSNVILRAHRADGDGESGVILEVQDDGPGLPESEHARVFERFHRVDKARSREMGGTGLGLAIVKHIALKHGGRAWVESRLGSGCSFRIAFPDGDRDDPHRCAAETPAEG